MLELIIHKQFIKDLKKAQLNPTNNTKLFVYVAYLLNQQNLPPESLDHALIDEWQDTREFHISGDLLVIYRLNVNLVELLIIGTQSQLF